MPDEFDFCLEHISKCPNCDCEFKDGFPCNECECCFCDENCRTEFHLLNKLEHDYNKELEDLS